MKVPGIIIHTFLIVGLLYGNIARAQDSSTDTANTAPRFKRLSNVQQKYLGWIDKKDREFPMGIPVIAGNKYDGLSVGAALLNLRQPVKHLDFTGVLLYGTQSKKVTGMADLDYYVKPKNSIVREIKPGIHFQSFSYENFTFPPFTTTEGLKYYRVSPEISIKLISLKEKAKNLEHILQFRSHLIYKKDATWAQAASDSSLSINRYLTKFYDNQLSYTFRRNHANYPVSASITFEQAKEFVKMYVELNAKVRYGVKDYNTGMHIRFFTGGFLYRNPDTRFRLYPNYGFNLSGKTGENDYLFEDPYFGRDEQQGFASQQLSARDGFMKVITPLNAIQVGQTVDFMMATNIVLDFPIKFVPIKLFFDLGYSVDKHLNPDNFLPVKGIQYDGGFMFSFLDRGIEFYFPVFMSKDFKDYYKANAPKFKQRITFSLDLTKIALHKRIRDMKF